jgi:2-phospho-L-lactate/phosphoenolpyruvate guanylyltransferase
MTESARDNWTVLLPVKVLARAKSRLAVLAGPRRWELALAMASDTVAAVVACPEVARVVVVTSDPVAGEQLAALGAVVVPDVHAGAVGLDGGGGGDGGDGSQDALNAALLHGAAVASRRWQATCLAALTADLPALRPAELAAALRAVAEEVAAGQTAGRATGHAARRAGNGTAFVPDAAGIGTTLYAAAPSADFRPAFGGASRARHALGGAAELALDGVLDGVPGLRRDVDTAEDLRAAVALGAGFRTTALAAELFADA